MSTTPETLLETTAAVLETTLAATEAAVTEVTSAAEELLDLESIKALLDGFDPASLLPDLSRVFGSLVPVCRFAVLIGPVVLLLLGLSYLILTPKEANYYLGYRCYFGMGSVQAWRFTQRLAGAVLGGLGLVLTVFMYLSSSGFDAMDLAEMVWKCVDYLVIQAVLALLATLTINLTAMIRFNHRGEYRKAVKMKNPNQ